MKKNHLQQEMDKDAHLTLRESFFKLESAILEGFGCENHDGPTTIVKIRQNEHGKLVFDSADLLSILPLMIKDDPFFIPKDRENELDPKEANEDFKFAYHTTLTIYRLFAIRVAVKGKDVVFKYEYYDSSKIKNPIPVVFNPHRVLYAMGSILPDGERIALQHLNGHVTILEECNRGNEVLRVPVIRKLALPTLKSTDEFNRGFKRVTEDDDIFKLSLLDDYCKEEGIPEEYCRIELVDRELELEPNDNKETVLGVKVTNNNNSDRLKSLYRAVETLDPKNKPFDHGGYTTLIKGRDITRYISQLSKAKGYGLGQVKGTLKVKHIPSEKYETLVSVGTINLSNRGAPIINIPIFASMDSVVRGEVYLSFNSKNNYGSYQAHLSSINTYKLCNRLENDHMFHNLEMMRSDDTLLTLTAKDNKFIELLGHPSENHSQNEKETVFKKMLINLYTIFATEQTLSKKQINSILDSYIGNSYVFDMHRDHIDNLVSRLFKYGCFFHNGESADHIVV